MPTVQGDGLVVGEGAEQFGHIVGLDEGAAGEGEREEPDEACGLDG